MCIIQKWYDGRKPISKVLWNTRRLSDANHSSPAAGNPGPNPPALRMTSIPPGTREEFCRCSDAIPCCLHNIPCF